MTPEKTLVMRAVASAIPSMMPMDRAEAPRPTARKTGRRLWIISDEMSMNRLTSPRTQTERGMPRKSRDPCVIGVDALFPHQ